MEKGQKDGFRKPVGEVRTCTIKLADSYEFIRDSLWEADSDRVSDGRYIADATRKRPHRILATTYSFRLGAQQHIAVRLDTLLPPRSSPLLPR